MSEHDLMSSRSFAAEASSAGLLQAHYYDHCLRYGFITNNFQNTIMGKGGKIDVYLDCSTLVFSSQSLLLL